MSKSVTLEGVTSKNCRVRAHVLNEVHSSCTDEGKSTPRATTAMHVSMKVRIFSRLLVGELHLHHLSVYALQQLQLLS